MQHAPQLPHVPYGNMQMTNTQILFIRNVEQLKEASANFSTSFKDMLTAPTKRKVRIHAGSAK